MLQHHLLADCALKCPNLDMDDVDGCKVRGELISDDV